MIIPASTPATTTSTAGPRLLDRLHAAARARGAPVSAADALVGWARTYILFHDKRHPSELDLAAATQFLEHVVKTDTNPYRRWRKRARR